MRYPIRGSGWRPNLDLACGVMPTAPGFSAMKARRLRSLLQRELGYVVVPDRGKGSHRRLEAPGRPGLWFAFHDGDEVGAAMIRQILMRQVGLTLDEAKEVVKRG